MFTDDLGYGDIASYGAADIKTPSIDQIGEDGVRFTQFYAISPVCTPSRAGFLTGRYPVRMGIHHVFYATSVDGMPESELTIAEALRDSGYQTGMVGKWHLGHRDRFMPLNQGFDEFAGMPYSNDMVPYPFIKGTEIVDRNIDQTQLTRRLTEEATSFINANRDNPFFLYVAHAMPHVPLYSSERFSGVSARGAYGDAVEEIDWSVGEIRRALEDNGILDNTLLVFSSDNGPWRIMGDDGGSAGTLRGGKGTTFEGGMRVPTLVMFPNTIPANRVVEEPATMLDWFPTFMHFAGIEKPVGKELDGDDIHALLTGEGSQQPAPREIAYYLKGEIGAYRKGDWKLKLPFSNPLPIPDFLFPVLSPESVVGIRSHDMLLFNLKDDPSESRNLIDEHPEKVQELLQSIADWESGLGELPANITERDFYISPTVVAWLKLLAKIAASSLLILVLLSILTGFLIGRRRRRD
ncbi:N-acetylgalactosamine-6-sulfatase [Pseudohalioglobus lutimaris]|uniref:N-acetylgalactosamine-6-sulfatase n=1 Tax=Pseudohalioglobus lutimaris TaxID=1737061 RepID=A0A2N5WYG1_9GAMM|nr:N-acetylgalactosamine-6-sulfatase [Pseudohalioglobus lutimaris]